VILKRRRRRDLDTSLVMSLKLNSRERPKSTGCISEDDGPIKLVMVGDSGVGKSCLLDKFLDDSSTNNFISTIGVDIRSREIYINNKRMKIQVWDTGGQQRYRPVLASCYRGALGVIIVFDVTNMVSFKNIQQWLIEVEEFSASSNIPRMLVGNKADLCERREVAVSVAEEFAAAHNITYMETSVIGKENIKEAFLELVKTGIRQ